LINPRTGRLALAGLAVVVVLLAGLAVWAAAETTGAARPLAGGLKQTEAQLDAMRSLGRLHATLDIYANDPGRETSQTLDVAETAMRRAIAALERERSVNSRELAADILPLLSSFRHKRRDHASLVAEDRRQDADAVYLQELQPLLAGLQTSIDESVPDPMRAMRQQIADVEQRGRLVGHVTAFAAPSGLLLLVLCAAVLRAYRRRLSDRDRVELDRTRLDAMTDALTGLGNRRALMADLEAALAETPGPGSRALFLFDLDGFKGYNDTFGHPAGDALLERLGGKLSVAARTGRTYRLGGDEFCLLTGAGDDPDAISVAAADALTEHGQGFNIGSSWGSVLLHEEAADATVAMQLADRRMYARKNGGRPSVGRQMRDVLLATLTEREPGLAAHVHDVAALAVAVGRRLDLTPVELDELARAAELHDIGKVAIPDSILCKPGPLSDEEWAFMRRHSVIGERILLAAPTMAGVARLVRSHHERMDGTGYPDRLTGEEIPLGARIISVCDAFHAMTNHRAYRDAIGRVEAVAELQRHTGTQFDPNVTAALLAAIDEQASSGTSEGDEGNERPTLTTAVPHAR
jgi:diguanylate cyclase (GGDEF)-like protein